MLILGMVNLCIKQTPIMDTEMIKKFLQQDPNNWKWLISFYAVALLITIILTIQI